MPQIEKYTQGTPSWTDYGAPDQHAAKSFYADLFGWEYDDMPMETDADAPAPTYSMGKMKGLHTAAIYTQVDEERQMNIPPHWKTYITIDDADAIASKITELGGSVLMQPSDGVDAGRMVIAQDPIGAMISFWQPDQHIGAQIRGEHGTMAWAELVTTDPEKAVDFYSELLEIEFSEGSNPEGGPYHVIMSGELGVGGIMQMPDEMAQMNVPSHWRVYFLTDDVDATVEIAKARGATITAGPMDMEDEGRVAYVTDPQGSQFGLLTPNEEMWNIIDSA